MYPIRIHALPTILLVGHTNFFVLKNKFNTKAASLLLPTDWYVIKATEVSDYSVPSAITTYRAAVRTKVNAMETAIDGCANVEALITLLEYTTDSDGVTSRPLGEFPDEVV